MAEKSDKPALFSVPTEAGTLAFASTFDTEKRLANHASEDSLPELDHHEVMKELRQMLNEHELDPNFPADILDRARDLLAAEGATADRAQARRLLDELNSQKELMLNDSPYAEVRAVVEPTDDPSTPVGTFRAFVLGTIFAILGTGVNQFFDFRYPGIWISTYVVQLLSMPCGQLLAKILPKHIFTLPGRLGYFSFNPGPFNQKEHMLITIMANVAFGGYNGTPYITSIIQVLKLEMYYNEKVLSNSPAWQIIMVLATQLIGYGCAGLTRRFLVYPAAMIWPSSLANIALNKTLHRDDGRETVHGWKISRLRFFLVSFVGMFCYYWLPGYLFEAFTYFNWMTWISPGNVKLAIITGSICGLGLNPLPTFDWNFATIQGDPIVTPFFSIVNVAAGMAVSGFIIAPIMYWKNVWNSAYLQMNENRVFDNQGELYNVSRILKPDFSLDEEAYHSYSIPYMSINNAVLYAAFLGLYFALITHVALWHRRELASGWRSLYQSVFRRRSVTEEFTDVHSRLMSAYKECPEWWYLALMGVAFTLACVGCACWPTGMPIWGVVLSIAICLLLQVPIGMVLAVTNMEVTLNVIAEYIGGYALEGLAIPGMIFKMFGYIATAQSIQFSADLKLAHYMKLPPRVVFTAQVYATILASFVALGVNAWALEHVPDICTRHQKDRFTCPNTNTFFLASIMWSAVGPRRLFGTGSYYNGITYGFIVGLLLPLPVYVGVKRWPKSWLRYVHVPVFLAGPLSWAPGNWAMMQATLVLGFFFNFFVKRRYTAWWQKYAYVLTSSFSAAIGLSAIVIFFAVQWQGITLDWWGNSVPYEGVDAGGWLDAEGNEVACALLPIPEGGFSPGF